jgi:acyl-ACP thioesterase
MSNCNYEEEFFLRNSDFSYKDEIKPQAILEILEEVAGRHASQLNMGYLDCKEKGLAWVVVRTKIEFLKDLINGANGFVETYPTKPGRIDCDRNYIIYDSFHNVCVKAVSKWILIDYNTRKIQRSNVVDFPTSLEENTIIEMPKKIKIDEDALLNNREDIKIKINDLDHNGHMNNARYAELVFNTFKIDEFRKIKSFECEYIKELKYNEDAYIMYDDIRNNYAIYNSNDELSFVMRIDWR